jgi:rhodanese-related sulfurtransferase
LEPTIEEVLMATDTDRTELLRLIDEENAQVIDVLPEREYTESHIPGAISIPLRRLNTETVSVLARDKPVVVY